MPDSLSRRMIAEVIRLYPEYAANPLDVQWNHGNATVRRHSGSVANPSRRSTSTRPYQERS